jgi:hypothetical protein
MASARVGGRLTLFQEASNAYDEPMSWVELSEKAFRMTHNPQSEVEIR